MATLDERLKDTEYKLWVKAGLCLASFKHGLEEFAEEHSKKVHAFVKAALPNTGSSHQICGQAKVEVKQGKKKWHISCCNVCQIYVDELIRLKDEHFKFKLSNWSNSDIQKWPNEHWEMVKVYMNEGQKPFHKTSKHTDLSGLVNFIDHCNIAKIDIQDKQNINKVREGRNTVMHSAAMKLSQAQFDLYTNAMIDLLLDPLFLCKIKDAQEAAKTITEIQQATFHISKQAEFEVLKSKTAEIESQNEKLQKEVEQLKIKYEEMDKSTDSKMKSIRNLVEQEATQREADIDELKEKNQAKGTTYHRDGTNETTKLSTELILVKKLINQDKDLYIKMDMRVKNVETTLEKTNEEFREVKQSHKNLMQQVDQIQRDLDEGRPAKWFDVTATDIQPLQERNAELEEIVKQLTSQLEDHDNLKSRNMHLENQLADQSEVKPRDKEIKQQNQLLLLTNTNKELNVQVKQLEHELQQVRSKITNDDTYLRNRNEALEYEVTTLKGSIERLKMDHKKDATEQEIQNLKSLNSYLEESIDTSSSEIEMLGRNIKTMHSELQMERNANISLKLEIEQQTLTINKIKSKREFDQKEAQKSINILLKDKQSQKDDYEHMLQQIQDKLNAFQKENEALIQGKSSLKDQLELLRKTVEETKQAHKKETLTLKQQIHELSLDCERLLKEREDTENVMQDLVETNIRQDKEIESLKSASLQRVDIGNQEGVSTSVKDMLLVIPTQIDISLSPNKVHPLITGAEFLPSGELVLCDNKNKIITLLNSNFKALDSLDLSGQPWDVSAVDRSTVIITLPLSKRLMYLQVSPKLQASRVIQLDMVCWGIVVAGDEIYVTHCSKLGEGEVIVLDRDGTLSRKLNVFENTATGYPDNAHETKQFFMFSTPDNLTRSTSGHIYVSDSDASKNSVTCLDSSGSTIYHYTDTGLQCPGGLCTDSKNNIIVCGNNTLQILTSDGKKVRSFHIPITPVSVAYRQYDDILVVGFDDKHLLVFKLSKLLEE